MTRDNRRNENATGDGFDSIFSTARPRPVPSGGRKEAIYDKLRSEWLANRQAAQTKRRYVISGIAASIVAAVVLTAQMNFGADSRMPPPDATLVRATGYGTYVNDIAIESIQPVNARLRFGKGDTIATGNDAALAIAWNTAGSLRVNASSSVKLVSRDRIELAAGEVYYDSRSHDETVAATISVDTPLGTIRHVGTQFLARVDGDTVDIGVREGQVEFRDRSDNVVYVKAGESVRIDKALRKAFGKLEPTDPTWKWTTAIAPQLDVDGRSTHEIIDWVSRETGRIVEYDDEAARAYAINDRIRGIGAIEPLTALAIVPIATELQFDVDDRTIRVRLTD